MQRNAAIAAKNARAPGDLTDLYRADLARPI